MKVTGVLDNYLRTDSDRLMFDEETAAARVALAVAELLEQKGWTQRQLAERIGVTEGRISQLLAADSNPTMRTLARIGNALGCELEISFSTPPPVEETVVPERWPLALLPRWEHSDPCEETIELADAA